MKPSQQKEQSHLINLSCTTYLQLEIWHNFHYFFAPSQRSYSEPSDSYSGLMFIRAFFILFQFIYSNCRVLMSILFFFFSTREGSDKKIFLTINFFLFPQRPVWFESLRRSSVENMWSLLLRSVH